MIIVSLLPGSHIKPHSFLGKTQHAVLKKTHIDSGLHTHERLNLHTARMAAHLQPLRVMENR